MSNQDSQTNLVSPPQENNDESDQKTQIPQSYKFTLISQLTRKTYKGTEHPSKRWGHSVIIHNKSMVIFGGHHSQRTLSNIYSLDFRTLNWSKIDQIGASPPARDSHSAILYNNEMIIFGGTGSEGNKYNDLWAFNFTNKRWTKKTTYGNDIPCKRDGHYASIIYDRYMVVFGGINELDAVIETVHLLDLTNDFWILTKNEGEQMSPRDSQGGTTIKNTLYIFGGQKNSNEDIYYNDMYEANFEINDQDKKYKTIWKKVLPAENSPLPPERASHTCVSYKDRFIIIIGGEGKKSQPLNDIWIFDTMTKYYSEVTISNHETFDSRLCHSSILYNDIIAIYGGIQNKDTTLDSLVLLEIESLSGNNAVNLANNYVNFINNNTNMSEEGKVQTSNENVEMLTLNKNLNSISTDTSDLVGQDFFTFEEIKKNYLNNLISWTFLKKLSEFNQWSLGCLGNFVMNSLKEQVSAKNIYIQYETYSNENTNEDVLSIIDDGRGISCLEFNQIMYSFSQNENKEYNFFQYGISMKTSAMRLADSFLIISKTENEVSIGLISQRLQKLIDSDLILTPIVNYKILSSANNLEGKYLPKSNYPLESIHLILDQIKFMFKSIDDINNHFEQMKTGTEIYLFDLHRGMANEYEFEFNKQEGDIVVNFVDKEFGSCVSSGIDTSLTCYLNFLQLNPSSTKIHILGKELNRTNPYYSIYLLSKNSSDAEKITYLKYENENNKQIDSFYINGDYKGALFNKKYVKSLIESSNCDTNDIREENFYNGVLLYKNNYLISRLNQSKFGDFAYFIKKTIKGKEDFYKVNGYVELPSKGYELMFSGKEIKDLAVFGFLYTKIKGLIKQINKN